MKSIVRVLDDYLEHTICGICLTTMASCILLQVILRFFFSQASAWAEELAIYSMVTAVYFGACLGVKERAHIRIVAFVNCLPRRLQITSVIFADLLWLSFLLFLLVQSVSYFRLLCETTFISPGLEIEMRWPQSVIPICLVLMCFRMAQVYLRWIRNDKMKGLPL